MYYGSDQTMWVGFYDQMRPVVHTPINGIPTDSPVDQAWLYLYVTEGRKFGNWSQSVLENVTAHPATTEWMPYAVNWWMPWTMPGGDYGPGGVPNHLGSGKVGTWLRLDVTAAVEDMLRSGENQGFLINSTVNASGVHYGLATKEYWDPSKLGYIRVYFRTAS
ncbi:MAG: DNRLRE domain-containing protein [Anaerolineae bacterium]|nr:DNRLRE domain-containing protein [Anaerolineae bacterium]